MSGTPSNGTDTVHFIYTEAHPRDYDTELYHIAYKGGSLYGSDGMCLAPLTEGITATQGTRIYQADAARGVGIGRRARSEQPPS